MSGEATFFHDIVGGGKNHARCDDFSESSEEPFDDDDAEGFSTTSLPKLTMSPFRTIPTVEPLMIASPFLHRHPLLSMFHQKLSCKIHLHHPTTQTLQSHLTINPAPTQMNPHPSPKEKALDTII
jgi:hypothetical protein